MTTHYESLKNKMKTRNFQILNHVNTFFSVGWHENNIKTGYPPWQIKKEDTSHEIDMSAPHRFSVCTTLY